VETSRERRLSIVSSREETSELLLLVSAEYLYIDMQTYEFGSSTPFKNGRHRCGTFLAIHCATTGISVETGGS